MTENEKFILELYGIHWKPFYVPKYSISSFTCTTARGKKPLKLIHFKNKYRCNKENILYL